LNRKVKIEISATRKEGKEWKNENLRDGVES
jgi:hypothetical protein